MIYKIVFWVFTLTVLAYSLYPFSNNDPIGGSDKIKHVAAFGIFVFLLLESYPLSRYASIGISVTYGLGIEILQFLSGYRLFSIGDVAFDAVGSVMGIAPFMLKAKYIDPMLRKNTFLQKFI